MTLSEMEEGVKTKRVKVISMGDAGVGKSCLIKRYCEGQFWTKYVCTIGVDYGVKPVTVRGAPVKVNFWDLSGHPDLFEVRNEFYRDAEAAILVFDVTSAESFAHLDRWLREATTHGAGRSLVIAVCGNKADKEERRAVTEAEARAWAAERRMEYFETSAKSGKNVNAAFEHLFDRVLGAATR